MLFRSSSSPSGADVWLDGANSGKTTDCSLDSVPFGDHQLVLKFAGKLDWEQMVSVVAGQAVAVACTLLPCEVGCYDTTGNARGVAVSGSFAYMANYAVDLRVIDVGNPQILAEVGCCVTPGNARGVAVSGSFAFVADNTTGLRSINVKIGRAHV